MLLSSTLARSQELPMFHLLTKLNSVAGDTETSKLSTANASRSSTSDGRNPATVLLIGTAANPRAGTLGLKVASDRADRLKKWRGSSKTAGLLKLITGGRRHP